VIVAWLLGVALAAPLTLDEVLDRVDARVPELAMAEAKRLEAEGKLLSKRGAFDPTLKGKVGRYEEVYDRTLAEAALAAPIALGPQLQAGWRLGSGEFPTYDERKTGEGGELYLRAEVPVLDGLGLPQARADLLAAGAAVRFAEADQLDKQLAIRRKATEAWAKWVAAGAKRSISEAFVEQTAARQQALDRGVEEGTRARLDQLDNLRALEQRRAELAAAEADLQGSAQALSLWWRDDAGRPQVPAIDQLPVELASSSPTATEADARALAESRPDAQRAQALVDEAAVAKRRARNALLPDLAAVGEGIRPVDDEQVPELYLGMELKLSTLFRKERGELARANAASERAQQLERGTIDAATARIEAARAAVDRTWEQVQRARASQEHAAEVVRLERRNFQLGGGDLFKLLSRESNLVKARKAVVDAELAHQLARAALVAEEARRP